MNNSRNLPFSLIKRIMNFWSFPNYNPNSKPINQSLSLLIQLGHSVSPASYH